MSEVPPEVSSWVRQMAVPLKSVTAGSGYEDLAPLGDWIGGARAVGLGESTHGTREFFQLKARMLEYLVAELGFTLFTIEASFAQSLAINHYVLTGEGDARHALGSLRYYDCEEVLELIEWMRRWNNEHRRKIHFYGFDMQAFASVLPLLGYLQQHDPAAYQRLREPLLPLTLDPTSYAFGWTTLSEAEKVDARAAIVDLGETLGSMRVQTAAERHELEIARLHAAALSQYERQMSTQGSAAWGIRDRAMADNVLALLKLHGPESKAVVWAHNDHIRLNSSGWLATAARMGQHLRAELGKQYFAFGFVFDRGSFEAKDRTNHTHEWSVASVPGTLEAALAQAGPPTFALDLRAVTGGAADWFSQAPASRCIGGVYEPGLDAQTWFRCDIREHFDALLFVRETTAARLNPAAYQWQPFQEDAPLAERFVNLDFTAGTLGWRWLPQPSVGAYQVRVMSEGASGVLEISRSETRWPWDNCLLWQTISAAGWRGKRITLSCTVSMQAAHDGSSAQLAVRAPGKSSPTAWQETWIERRVWQSAVTRDARMREVSLTIAVDESTDLIGVAAIMTGDGCARFGPVRITAGDIR